MKKDHHYWLSRICVILDALFLPLIYIASARIWLTLFRKKAEHLSLDWRFTLAYVAVGMLMLIVTGVYDSVRRKRLRQQFAGIVAAAVMEALVFVAGLFLLHLDDYSRGVLLVGFVLTCLILTAYRLLAVRIILRILPMKDRSRHCLIVGTGVLARKCAEDLLGETQDKLENKCVIDGFLGDDSTCPGYLGSFDDLDRVLENPDVDEVIAALDIEELSRMKAVVSACEKAGTKISIVPFYNDLMPDTPAIECVGSSKLINLRSIPLDNLGKAALKRAFDIAVSVLLLIVLSPLLLVTALAVKLSSPGPVFFRQDRVGRNKKLFKMIKFRSMRVNAKQDTGWSKNTDDRKTAVGSLIRKCSIDELPQLFNVLKGDMSLIGPRPEIPFYVEQFKDTVPLYMVKHQVRPGMTGWAQVNGYRGDTSIPMRIRYDIWYIEHWSVRLDLKILLMTAFGGFLNKEKVK